jgi:hypothetical protein
MLHLLSAPRIDRNARPFRRSNGGVAVFVK